MMDFPNMNMNEHDEIYDTILRMETEDTKQRQDNIDREYRWRSVPRETGKFLYQMVMIHQPQLIVEVGMSHGYSTIWMGLAAQSYGGKIWSYEVEEWRYQQALQNFSNCQLENTIQPNLVDTSFSEYPQGIDMVFIDAEKSDYLKHIKSIEENLTDRAIILADNTVSHESELREYVEYMRQSKYYFSHGIELGKGLELSRRIKNEEKMSTLSKL